MFDQTNHQLVELGGVEEMKAFSIAANGKAFRILIAGLYSNKIQSITRELWTNAYDSHVAAGCADRPFTCKLPTRWDSSFSVRDYGTSMTHEQIMGLYSTVFASTKDTTNTQVGKFGLGSKTPFALTDAFNLAAYLDGEKRLYNAYIDTDGVPKIALFHREPSDEERGLEVSFPTQDKDREAFRAAAEAVVMGFDVVPLNNLDIKKPELNTILEGDGWRLLRRHQHLHSPTVRQGCVLYPLNLNTIMVGAKSPNLVNALSNQPILIDMPIGSVDITPSRESLSYDPTTIANIVARFEVVVNDIARQWESKLSSATSIFEAMRLLNTVLNQIPHGALRNTLMGMMRWGGRGIPQQKQVTDAQIKQLAKRGLKMRESYSSGFTSSSDSIRWRFDTCHRIYVDGGNEQPIFFCYYKGTTTPRYLGARVNAAVKALANRTVIVIENFDPNHPMLKVLWHLLGRPPNFEKWFVDLDAVEFEIPTLKETLTQAKWVRTDGKMVNVKKVTESDAEPIYYIHTNRYDVVFDERELRVEYFAAGWAQLKNILGLHPKSHLLALPASRKDLMRDIPETWTCAITVIERYLKEHCDAKTQSMALALRQVDNHVNYYLLHALAAHENIPDVHPKSRFLAIRDVVSKYRSAKPHDKVEQLLRWAFSTEYDALLKSINIDKPLAILKKHIAELEQRYPLLTAIYNNSGPKQFAQYINAMDLWAKHEKRCAKRVTRV